MEQTLTAWLLPAITLVAGIAIGFLIARLAPNAAPGRTQRQLDDIKERFDTYQSEVVTHFNTTANLVKKLSQTQLDVQQHLSEGASRLALDELTRQRLLATLHAEDNGEKRERLKAPTHHEMPKDYAPKSADVPGMLDESYGLKSKSKKP